MTKAFFTTSFAFILSISAFAQKSVQLNLFLKPNTTYFQKFNSSNDMEMTYSGNEESLEQMSKNGIKNPSIQKSSVYTEGLLTTGSLNSQNQFPIQLEYKKLETKGSPNAIAQGAIFYGFCSPTTLPTFDSVSAGGVESSAKDVLLNAINSIYRQTKLPSNTFKIGDEVSIGYPVSVPIGGLQLEMEITTFYKLTEIINGEAIFTTRNEVKLTTAIKDVPMTGKGTGLGKLIYNIKDGFFKTYANAITIELEVSSPDISLSMKLTQTQLHESSIQN